MSQIRLAGRATQGVRIINLRDGDAIASVMPCLLPAMKKKYSPRRLLKTGAQRPKQTAGRGIDEMNLKTLN